MNNDQNKEQEMTEDEFRDEIVDEVMFCSAALRLVPEIPRILHARMIEMLKDEDEASALEAYMMMQFIISLCKVTNTPIPKHDRSGKPWTKKEEKVAQISANPPTRQEIVEMVEKKGWE